MRTIRARLPGARRGPALAAAVAFRRHGGALQVRLVRTSDGARWTLPKGRRERGETLAQTAAREAVEEAGVSGVVGDRPLTEYRHAPSRHAGRTDDPVAAFLLAVQGVGHASEPGRESTWFDLDTARDKLAEGRQTIHAEELARVLAAAERELRDR